MRNPQQRNSAAPISQSTKRGRDTRHSIHSSWATRISASWSAVEPPAGIPQGWRDSRSSSTRVLSCWYLLPFGRIGQTISVQPAETHPPRDTKRWIRRIRPAVPRQAWCPAPGFHRPKPATAPYPGRDYCLHCPAADRRRSRDNNRVRRDRPRPRVRPAPTWQIAKARGGGHGHRLSAQCFKEPTWRTTPKAKLGADLTIEAGHAIQKVLRRTDGRGPRLPTSSSNGTGVMAMLRDRFAMVRSWGRIFPSLRAIPMSGKEGGRRFRFTISISIELTCGINNFAPPLRDFP